MIREEGCFDNTSCRTGQLMKGKGSSASKIYIVVISDKRGKSGQELLRDKNKSLGYNMNCFFKEALKYQRPLGIHGLSFQKENKPKVTIQEFPTGRWRLNSELHILNLVLYSRELT